MISYLEFTGNSIALVFNANTTEIAFPLRSSYSFRGDGVLPSYSYRTTFDVLDSDRQEDILFGKDAIQGVRILTNGNHHFRYLNNREVWKSTYVVILPNWGNTATLIIGSTGHTAYGHRYYSSDDLIDEFSLSTGTPKSPIATVFPIISGPNDGFDTAHLHLEEL